MSITFTQYCLPNGKRIKQVFDGFSPEIDAIAARFIASGGKYECETLTTGEISLTAVKDIGEGEDDVAIVLCRKGQGGTVGDRIADLVRQSEAFI